MLNSKARFYDGVKPIPRGGWVSLTPEALIFKNEGYDERFPLEHISLVELQGGEVRVTIKNLDRPEISFVIVIEDRDIYKPLLRMWSRKNRSFFTRLSLSFRAISMPQKVALLGVAILAIAGTILFASQRAYLLVPLSADKSLGDALARQLEKELVLEGNSFRQKRLNRIAKDLLPKKSPHQYRFSVVTDSRINAFAAPGGHIYFFSGLIDHASSDEEIAAVVAHEIGHVEKRHSMQQLIRTLGLIYVVKIFVGTGFEELDMIEAISELSGLLMIFNYSRAFEREADLFAAELLRERCHSIGGLIDFLKNYPNESIVSEKMNWLSTHPSNEERIQYLEDILAKERLSKRCTQ